MQWTGKLIGGAVGMALGPLGAALGVAIGHQYDLINQRRSRPSGEQFFLSTFRLMGHVAKADGRVSERDIEAARQVMRELRLDARQVQVAIAEFTRGKQPQFDLDEEMGYLRAACQSQPAVLRAFVEIQLRYALAARDMAGNARQRVVRAAGLLGFAPGMLERMEAAMRGNQRVPAQDLPALTAAAYRTLETEPSVSNTELTRVYRRLMSRHHPDKLKANGLPESMLEHAKQRTQAIREAYELLRGQRGMS
jgi:DnaJ like chaperone protein